MVSKVNHQNHIHLQNLINTQQLRKQKVLSKVTRLILMKPIFAVNIQTKCTHKDSIYQHVSPSCSKSLHLHQSLDNLQLNQPLMHSQI